MQRVGAKQARAQFFEILSGTSRVMITVRGVDIAGVVGPTEARLLEWLAVTEKLDEMIERMRQAGEHPGGQDG